MYRWALCVLCYSYYNTSVYIQNYHCTYLIITSAFPVIGFHRKCDECCPEITLNKPIAFGLKRPKHFICKHSTEKPFKNLNGAHSSAQNWSLLYVSQF